MGIGTVALFVPAISEHKMEKITNIGANTIYFDLEDAVGYEQKNEARDCLAEFLKKTDLGAKYVVTRINGINTDWWEADVKCFEKQEKVDAFLLPNADVKSTERLVKILDKKESTKKLIVLIETSLGLEECVDVIKMSKRIIGIQFGAEDYTADLGVTRTAGGEEIRYARSRLVNLAHAYGIEVMDTPCTSVGDVGLLEQETLVAKALGFTGKAAIHPAHVETINRIFSPSEEEIQYALAILQAAEIKGEKTAGAFNYNGKMIDAPILERARAILKKAKV